MSTQTADTSDEEQRRRAEFATDGSQCQAIAESTGEQCRRDRVAECVPYCPLHLHLLDDNSADRS